MESTAIKRELIQNCDRFSNVSDQWWVCEEFSTVTVLCLGKEKCFVEGINSYPTQMGDGTYVFLYSTSVRDVKWLFGYFVVYISKFRMSLEHNPSSEYTYTAS